MDPSEIKECKMCNITKLKENFHKKQSICKECRLGKDKERYSEEIKKAQELKILERQPIRNEFKKYLITKCINNNEKFDKECFEEHYIPFEKLELMKKQKDLYGICEVNRSLKRDNANHYKYEFEHFILDMIIIHNIKMHSCYVAYII
jgi:hypothetical protein